MRLLKHAVREPLTNALATLVSKGNLPLRDGNGVDVGRLHIANFSFSLLFIVIF